MSEVQLFFSGLLVQLVDRLPLGYAFGAGMMSSVSPCGFSLLPVYLGLFLGAREEDFRRQALWARLYRALVVAGVVSSGFVLLFGSAGLLIAAGARVLTRLMPWLAVVIGAALMALGMWMLGGRTLPGGALLRLTHLLGDPRRVSLRGFLVYGLAYGICSLSCTLPVFLVVVGNAVAAGGFLLGLLQFISYGLGMGAVILALTLGMALFKEGLLLEGIRRFMPVMQPATAVLVILAGGYIVYYWSIGSGGLL